ncbi:perlucin-like protein [Rana temporaria]|uniref:perlucin-like protein n=1 Tax=Rana temporaria TaxID=8407 RepID=UPI001AACF6C8|nr:perlucin-like protein [Rana temporaria]
MRKVEDFEAKSGNCCLGNTYANMNDLKAQMSENNPEAKATKNIQDRLTLVLVIFLILVFLILVIFTSLLFVYLKECTSQFENKLEQHKNETKPSCESGWLEFDGHCYFFSDFQLNWMSAQMMCLNRGSYLVIITSEEEQKFLLDKYNKKNNIWIGLTDERKEGTFQWIDGTELSYTFWRKGEPNGGTKENCVNLFIEREWNDYACNSNSYAICEKRLI